ncbi:MAG: hypothetical protein U1E65_07945 [Myxococcota bacterium]
MQLGLLCVLPLLTSAQRPPEWLEGPERSAVLKVGEESRLELGAFDPLGEPVEFSAEGLPPGASLRPSARGASLSWTPGAQDVGAKEVVVLATSAAGSSQQKLHLSVEQSWRRYLVPAASASFYLPNDSDKWGALVGASLALHLFSWRTDSARPGPAQGRVYLAFDLRASTKAAVSTQLDVALGLALSLESNPGRSWLIPHYGLELAAMFQKQLGSALAVARPLVGLGIYWSPSVAIDLDAGYALPLSGSSFDELRGLTARLGLSLCLF